MILDIESHLSAMALADRGGDRQRGVDKQQMRFPVGTASAGDALLPFRNCMGRALGVHPKEVADAHLELEFQRALSPITMQLHQDRSDVKRGRQRCCDNLCRLWVVKQLHSGKSGETTQGTTVPPTAFHSIHFWRR